MSEANNYADYPRSIFCIIATEFCERFSFCGLRTILSLYLRNVLLFHENASTVIYHVFIMICYFNPIVGALFADSLLGRFRTILYFSIVYLIGNIIMCLAATPPLQISPIPATYVGLLLIAIGTGGIKPCVAAFGGDQFKLPEQELQLQQFFSIFYFTINFGGFVGMILTPILRKSVMCFGDETCYSLGFGFPAGLMLLALLMFISGKRCYVLKMPKENIMLKFIECMSYALIQKHKNPKKVPPEHWLDYSKDKYGENLVYDMKIVFSILFLYIPLPLFWSLFDQQGSRWTFQASKMNGALFGYQIVPDQMQVVNPAIVLLLIPLFDKIIYPCLDSCGEILTCPLQRMIYGGLIAGLAFIASGLLELKLEETYPLLPHKGQSALYVVNTLPCEIQVSTPFHKDHFLNSSQMYRYNNLTSHNVTDYEITIEAPSVCSSNLQIASKVHHMKVAAVEFQVHTIFIAVNINDELTSFVPESIDFTKSLSGKPRLRIVYISTSKQLQHISVILKRNDGFTDIYFVPNNRTNALSVSSYVELMPGDFEYYILFNDKTQYKDVIYLAMGGVYSLVIRERHEVIEFTQLFTMTPPNTVHMLWLLPQYFLISIAEIMFAISGLEFSFTQAPKSMKTITIAAWYLSVALGNFLVILITQAKLFRSQAYEFLFFAGLIIINMLIFAQMTKSYEFVNIVERSSTHIAYKSQESVPLLRRAEESVYLS